MCVLETSRTAPPTHAQTCKMHTCTGTSPESASQHGSCQPGGEVLLLLGFLSGGLRLSPKPMELRASVWIHMNFSGQSTVRPSSKSAGNRVSLPKGCPKIQRPQLSPLPCDLLTTSSKVTLMCCRMCSMYISFFLNVCIQFLQV